MFFEKNENEFNLDLRFINIYVVSSASKYFCSQERLNSNDFEIFRSVTDQKM